MRYAWGSQVTDYTLRQAQGRPYTGQRSEMASIGLMYYNARWGACPERSEGTPPWAALPRRIPSSPARGTRWRLIAMRMSTTIQLDIQIRRGTALTSQIALQMYW